MALHEMRNQDVSLIQDDRNENIEGVSEDWEVITENKVAISDLSLNLFWRNSVRPIVGTILMIPVLHAMAGHTRSADETLFGRQYVDPLLVNPGFITEDVNYDIVVWNADNKNTTSITSITVVNQSGTTLVYSALPISISRGDDEVLTLTIYNVGPPTQDTQYTIDVGVYSYELDVQGIRAIALEADPNWADGIRVEYAWVTAMATNHRYFREQRRPLSILPWRNVSMTLHAHDLTGMNIQHTLRYGKDKVFVIPIYTEQITCDAITPGASLITPNHAYDKYYNLNNNCTHLVFLDLADMTVEIKEVDTVGASTISFVSTIAATMDPNTTVIYPTVFSTISQISMEPDSDNLSIIKLAFQEYKKSG